MIISDKYNFVFIHIPKCAGTIIRSKLQPLDQTGGRFTSRVDEHPQLGTIDYVHIPLFILREYFATEYRKLRTYFSFAVVRDPFRRFPSSLSQHIRIYGDDPIQNMRASDIKRNIDKTIGFLLNYEEHYLPYQYIHFQRQVDFIYDGQERVVDNIYHVSELSGMLTDIGNRFNIQFVEEESAGNSRTRTRTNQTIVYRNNFFRAVNYTARPLLKLVLGHEYRKKLREIAEDWIFVPRDKKFKDIFESSYIQDFIRDYYASDIKLVNELDSNRV